jgi:DivIVA domain-containing protein
VDEHSIARIRNASFSHSVRGYDRGEVDWFLAEVADWIETGGGEYATASEGLRAELERVGERTGTILTEAHAAAEAIREDAAAEVRKQLVDANVTAESLRAEAGDYAADTRDEADAYARRVRADADEYLDRARSEADAELIEQRTEAQKEAERVVAEANRRKADIEAVISDLEECRDAVLAKLDELASRIAAAAAEHRRSVDAESPPADAGGERDAERGDAVADDTDEQSTADDAAETTVLVRESD